MTDLSQQVVELNAIEAERVLAAAEEIAHTQSTPGWQMLMRALQDLQNRALAELSEVDPTDWRAVARLQNAANRYKWFETTVDELLTQAASIRTEQEVGAEGDAITE